MSTWYEQTFASARGGSNGFEIVGGADEDDTVLERYLTQLAEDGELKVDIDGDKVKVIGGGRHDTESRSASTASRKVIKLFEHTSTRKRGGGGGGESAENANSLAEFLSSPPNDILSEVHSVDSTQDSQLA